MISDKKIYDLQKILHYEFNDVENLKISLVHPSVFIGMKKPKNKNVYEFERLEFLGDRVLGLVVASLIFKKFKLYNEGDLSKKFSFLVQRDFLYFIAQEIKLEKYIKFNKQKKINKSILADSLESLIGAIFKDGGYQKSFLFIKRVWSPHLNKLISEELNPKSKLQEIQQKKYQILPEYNLIKKEGLPHSPKFTISLNALNFKDIRADGDSIREAQKNAAKKLLNLFYEK